MTRTVTVIGAGIAGLVAAWHLDRAGMDVTVIEAADQPGGRVGQREVRGIRFNTGARLLYPFSKGFNRLLDDLGLRGDLVPIRGLSATCEGPDGSWTVELMPGWRSLLTPGLTLTDRLRLIPYGLGTLAAMARTDPDDATTAPSADAETLAAHVTRRLGPRVLERMIDPVFRSTRSWDAGDVSAAFLATTMPHMLGRRTVHVLRDGMNSLPEALARDLRVMCNTRALRVESPEGGPCRVLTERDGGESLIESDLVVVAVEGSRVGGLVPGLAPEDRAFMEGVRYNALGIAHFRLKRQVAPRMAFFAGGAGGSISTYQQIPGDEAKGSHPQLYVQLTPEAVREAEAQGMTGDIDKLVAPDLARLHPTLEADYADHHNQWIAHKLPVFHPGYATALRRFLDRQAAGKHRIQFCGDYLAQSLVTGAAASGAAAARRVVAQWT